MWKHFCKIHTQMKQGTHVGIKSIIFILIISIFKKIVYSSCFALEFQVCSFLSRATGWV